MNLLDWASKFVETPSVSADGNHRIVARAVELLTELGLDARVHRTQVDSVEHHWLTADLPGTHDDGLILLTHLDTVPPGDASAWTATGGDPFNPTPDGDKLFGLGSADAKVDFVCKATAMAKFRGQELSHRLRLVGTFGEEIGLLGARELVRSGMTAGFAFAMIGEPSELSAIRAHKGYHVFEARIPLVIKQQNDVEAVHLIETGQSAHSSTPHLGKNAIEQMFNALRDPAFVGLNSIEAGQAVNKIPDHCSAQAWKSGSETGNVIVLESIHQFHDAWRELLASLQQPKDENFDPDHTVGNIGKIRVEDCTAVVTFDLRPVPGVDPEQAVQPLGEFAELRSLRRNPPLNPRENSRLLHAVVDAQKAIGLSERVATKATCTEAGLLSEAGLDAVILGAGVSIGNVHRPNEYTLISQLDQARRIYEHVIGTLCTC